MRWLKLLLIWLFISSLIGAAAFAAPYILVGLTFFSLPIVILGIVNCLIFGAYLTREFFYHRFFPKEPIAAAQKTDVDPAFEDLETVLEQPKLVNQLIEYEGMFKVKLDEITTLSQNVRLRNPSQYTAEKEELTQFKELLLTVISRIEEGESIAVAQNGNYLIGTHDLVTGNPITFQIETPSPTKSLDDEPKFLSDDEKIIKKQLEDVLKLYIKRNPGIQEITLYNITRDYLGRLNDFIQTLKNNITPTFIEKNITHPLKYFVNFVKICGDNLSQAFVDLILPQGPLSGPPPKPAITFPPTSQISSTTPVAATSSETTTWKKPAATNYPSNTEKEPLHKQTETASPQTQNTSPTHQGKRI